jgi:hypothetical protein
VTKEGFQRQQPVPPAQEKGSILVFAAVAVTSSTNAFSSEPRASPGPGEPWGHSTYARSGIFSRQGCIDQSGRSLLGQTDRDRHAQLLQIFNLLARGGLGLAWFVIALLHHPGILGQLLHDYRCNLIVVYVPLGRLECLQVKVQLVLHFFFHHVVVTSFHLINMSS